MSMQMGGEAMRRRAEMKLLIISQPSVQDTQERMNANGRGGNEKMLIFSQPVYETPKKDELLVW